jgi:hypothetical protein
MTCQMTKVYRSAILFLFSTLTAKLLFATPDPKQRIPFTLYGNHTFIKLKTDFSKDSLNFIFDIGAGLSILSKDVFDKVAKQRGGAEKKQLEGAGGFENANTLDSVDLHFGTMVLDDLTIYSFNANSLSESIGQRIDGVIGADILKKYQVFINYNHSTLELYDLDQELSIKDARHIGFELVEDIPVIHTTITSPKGKKIKARLYFDSGAGISLILNTPFVQLHALDKEMVKLVSYKIQGMGGASSSVLATFPSLQIGEFSFTNVPVSLSRAKQGVSAAADIDGILGNDVIKHFNVLLNYQTKKMALLLNNQHESGYKKHFSGARYKIRNKEIFIDAILSGSPAEQAGLLPQDIILTVNGKAFNDIESFRKAVDKPGEKLNFRINRKGQVLDIRLIATSFY